MRFSGALLFWLMCLPLALFAGYMLATPTDLKSLGVIGLVFLFLISPVLLRWHHELLIASWNSFIIVFFLPGQPSLAVAMAMLSFFIAIVTRTLRKEGGFIRVPSITFPLLFLTTVVLVTAFLTGGINVRVLGSSTYGGKRYLMLLSAVVGYFALTSQSIPQKRGMLLASLFFLGGLTGAMSDVVYAAGPSFYFLFVLFSSNLASLQALSQETLLRFSGLAWGALAVCQFMIMRFGLKGLVDLSHPWRLVFTVTVFAISLLGGFRSTLVVLGLIFFIQFYAERLYRTPLLPIFLLAGIMAFAGLVVFIEVMPLAVQRSLSFLPLNVDPMAKHDALSTLDWRFEIWKMVVKEIPQYFWLGKGFSFSGVDSWLTQEGMKRGFYPAFEETLVSGNYHSGPLTTIIPFGIFGVIGFAWFCVAGFRVLLANHRYGNPALANVNCFLLVFFVARLVFFLVFYGQLDLDLMIFTGVVGLSISLNNGVCGEQERTAPQAVPMFRTAIPARAF